MGETSAVRHDRVTTILWDNDGVLVDTEGLYYEATRRVLGEYGVALTPPQYIEFCLHDNRGAWHLVRARGVPRKDIDAARECRNALYTELLRTNFLLIDGVLEVLKALQGRFRMGVVTSSRRDHLEVIHERTGLGKFFDFVVTADEVTETKPSPELYERGLAEADIGSDEAVVFEDSSRGLRAATAAGIACYVIPTEWTRGSDFSAASGVLKSVRDVPGLLTAARGLRVRK